MPTIPNSQEQSDDKAKDLERKKQELQAKIQELEWQLSNGNLSENERRLKEQELIANKELLQELMKELGKLQKNQSLGNPTNIEDKKGGSKLNWIIGLGIVAAAIIFFRFLLLLRKRKH